MKRIEGRDAGRLTRRERILLGVLGILLLWTCVLRLAIAPAQRRLDEARLALGEERTRRAACAEWLKMAWENRAVEISARAVTNSNFLIVRDIRICHPVCSGNYPC